MQPALWQRIGAVEPAAAARAAGDWHTAAALAHCDVDVDLEAVRDHFGAEAAAALHDDLRHLCLDLLWWHLPRHRGGMSTLQPRVSAVLAPSVGAATAPLLQVRLPKSPTGPQRLRLTVTTFEELANQRWYVAPRHTWDVRHTAGLRAAWAVDAAVRDLLAAGETAAAWKACGIEVPAEAMSGPANPAGVAEEVRAAAAAFDVEHVATLYGASLTITVAGMTAEVLDVSEYLETPVRVLVAAAPPDLPLVAAHLHPLIRAALPSSAVADMPPSPSDVELGAPARVRCQGVWHQVRVAGGTLQLADHDSTERLREAMLQSLGGAGHGCFAVRTAWTTGRGRLPHVLAEQRRHLRQRLQHGDTDWLLRGLEAGVIDPHLRDGNGWSLLHLTMWLDHTRVLPVLLAAGLPVDARDRIDRTPLYLGVMNGADPAYLQALLAAGADPRAQTVHGSYAAYVARHRNDWQDLPFL